LWGEVDDLGGEGERPAEELALHRSHAQQALHAGGARDLRRVPVDPGLARELEQVAAREVDEQEPRATVPLDVAERVEEEVAEIVRDRERAVRLDAHEPRPSAAMRDVDAVAPPSSPCGKVARRDEERVGMR